MNIPKVGEWWYISCNNVIVLAKVSEVSKTSVSAYIPQYKSYISCHISLYENYVKWKPNLFWRALGYE